ncbi:MAG: hypothetical protein GWP60_04130 [Gammaproteobacteria bacterium]|nr:hypothetical protein [Gammaproteobacteria bacterium]
MSTRSPGIATSPNRLLVENDLEALDEARVRNMIGEGVAVAFVTFGYGPEPPDTHRPDYRIDAFSDLPAVVAGHSAGQAVT